MIRDMNSQAHPRRFSKMLLKYIMNDDVTRSFLIGNWLESLDNDDLDCLCSITEEILLNAPLKHNPIAEDILICAKYAYKAEGYNIDFENDMEILDSALITFCYAANFEAINRQGYVQILNTLSMNPDAELTFKITELGIKNKDSFKDFIH